jgi:hypothetical protein
MFLGELLLREDAIKSRGIRSPLTLFFCRFVGRTLPERGRTKSDYLF